jgi:hypothetical protein
VPSRGACLLLGLALIALVAALCGCEVDGPATYATNQRYGEFQLDDAAIPRGQLTVESSLDQITVTLEQFPALVFADGSPRAFFYEGWLTTEADTGLVYYSTGRFRTTPNNGDQYFPRGSTTFTYQLDGTFQVTSGGEALGGAAPFPDTLGPEVSFELTIQPEPASGSVTPIRPLILPVPMPDSASTHDLIVPADVGQATEGTFDRLRSEISINTVSGEMHVRFQLMAFFRRNLPGTPSDPGLMYQAWLVDDDMTPPRVVSVDRFNPNLAGDYNIDAQIYPGDLDGDGVPEPIDFERMWVSIEPDGITSSQPLGDGLDTSAPASPADPDDIDHIFPALIYEAMLSSVN